MMVSEVLQQFYRDNGIPENGGSDQDTFVMKAFGLSIKLPNPSFRKKAIHVHDLQHIINDCDISWKGEGFIAGWEIATGLWKHFPLSFISLWAMGYSLWIYPKSVYKGFKQGINSIGVIDLNYTKDQFLKMPFTTLLTLTTKPEKRKMRMKEWSIFIFWCIFSQAIFIGPLIGGLLFFLYLFL